MRAHSVLLPRSLKKLCSCPAAVSSTCCFSLFEPVCMSRGSGTRVGWREATAVCLCLVVPHSNHVRDAAA